MGYDITGDGEATLPLKDVPGAIKALKKAHREKHKAGSIAYLKDAESLVANIEKLTGCFVANVRDDVIDFRPSDDVFRHLSEDQWFFEAIGHLLVGEFEFRGEDGIQWRWDFGVNGFEEVDSKLVWGREAEAPHIAGEIEDLIYDSATNKIRDHKDPQAVLDQIEELLRKNGYGPFAGMEVLDILAKVSK